MKRTFKDFLFAKKLIVSSAGTGENQFEVLYALANLFGIRIIEGSELADMRMIHYVSVMLGKSVPAPFYRGFPQSVRSLSPEKLLFDQCVHYTKTYGFSDFSSPGHSVMEQTIERTAFNENCKIKNYSIITETEAEKRMKDYVDDLLSSTRPLNGSMFSIAADYIEEYNYKISRCPSKNTAIRLLVHFRSTYYAQFLDMPDVLKVVEEILRREYSNYDKNALKKLNLRNKDRKLITQVINEISSLKGFDIEGCCERKAVWCGLLHHIHYKAENKDAEAFVNALRGKHNYSAYSRFEKEMNDGNIKNAVTELKRAKGAGAVIRKIDYIISRCKNDEDVNYVLECINTDNTIILIQLFIRYYNYKQSDKNRIFVYVCNGMVKHHEETNFEAGKRKTVLSNEKAYAVRLKIYDMLKKCLKNRLGKVYIDPCMKNIALPIQESAAQGGFGILPKGSKVHIDECKKIRAFTYWEKVNDIDLSVIGITYDGRQKEFSWRTMAFNQSRAIVYSGDETSGWYGGSEFYDIDVNEFKRTFPTVQYLIFCDNVYSDATFDQCICTAGYMIRDKEDSGAVFEPKTVESSFRVNCSSRFAYLFAIDVEKNDFIWLNIANDSAAAVAGTTDIGYIKSYINVTDAVNVYSFFEMLAAEVTDDPNEADVIVSDEEFDGSVKAEIIRSTDIERITALMNERKAA